MQFCIFKEVEIEESLYANTKEHLSCVNCPYLGVCTSNKYKLMEQEDQSNYEIVNLSEKDAFNKEGFQILFNESELPEKDDIFNADDDDLAIENKNLDYLEDADINISDEADGDDDDEPVTVSASKKTEKKEKVTVTKQDRLSKLADDIEL